MTIDLETWRQWSFDALPVLPDAAIKATALLLLAGAAAMALRKASAAARQTLWLSALAAMLAVPLASALLPAWRVLPGWASVEVKAEAHASSAPLPVAASQAALAPAAADASPAPAVLPPSPAGVAERDEELAAYSPPAPRSQSDAPTAQAPAATAEPPAPPPAPQPLWPRVAPWLPVVWAAGTFLCLLPLVLGRLSLWRLARRSRPPGADWDALARRAAQAVGLRRRPTLLLSDAEPMPMVWGILRPRLLLPEQAEGWSPQRGWVVLLHELAHARRRDCLAKMIAHLACAMYWFNPLCWVAFKLMQRESEAACDDLVLGCAYPSPSTGEGKGEGASPVRPSDYAQHLLEIAGKLKSGLLAAHSSIAMARKSKLEGRLLAILDTARNRGTLTRLSMLVAAAIVAGVVVFISMMTPAAGNDQRTSAMQPRMDLPYVVNLSKTPGVSIVKVRDGNRRIGKPYRNSSSGPCTFDLAAGSLLDPILDFNNAETPIIRLTDLPIGSFNISATTESGRAGILKILDESYRDAFKIKVAERMCNADVFVITCHDRQKLRLAPSSEGNPGFLHKTNDMRVDCPFDSTMKGLASYAGYMMRKGASFQSDERERDKILSMSFVDETGLNGMFRGRISFNWNDRQSLIDALEALGLTVTPGHREIEALVIEPLEEAAFQPPTQSTGEGSRSQGQQGGIVSPDPSHESDTQTANDPADATGAFPEEASRIVAEIVDRQASPFVSPEQVQAIRKDFQSFRSAHTPPHLNDGRKKDILRALRDRAAEHLGIAGCLGGSVTTNIPGEVERFRERQWQTVGPKFPDALKTLQWELWMAVTRPPLDVESQRRLDEQRQWMRQVVLGLAAMPDRGLTPAQALQRLETKFNDALCTEFDRPMTAKQFEDFQAKIDEHLRDAITGRHTQTAQGSIDVSSHNPLPFIVHRMVWTALNVQYRGPRGRPAFPLFDRDQVNAFRCDSDIVYLTFASNHNDALPEGNDSSSFQPATSSAPSGASQPSSQPATQPAGQQVQTDWSEPQEGVQLRLRAERRQWRVDEVPLLRWDVRNDGKYGSVQVADGQRFTQLEVDGIWYLWPPFLRNARLVLLKGQSSLEDQLLTLSSVWSQANAEELKWWLSDAFGYAQGPPSLLLTPGRHRIRAAIIVKPFPAGDPFSHRGFRMLSPPLEIEIALPPGAGASPWPPSAEVAASVKEAISAATTVVQQSARPDQAEMARWVDQALAASRRTVTEIDRGPAKGTPLHAAAQELANELSALKKVLGPQTTSAEFADVRSAYSALVQALSHEKDPATQPASAPSAASQVTAAQPVSPNADAMGEWGPPGQVLQLRLRRPTAAFREGETPRLLLDARNMDPTANGAASLPQFLDQVELDGAWFAYGVSFRAVSFGAIPHSVPVAVRPGTEVTGEVRLSHYWFRMKPGRELAVPPGTVMAEALSLSPGKHTVRYRSVGIAGNAPRVIAVSNAVEIEVLPAATPRPASQRAGSDLGPASAPASQPAIRGESGFSKEVEVTIEYPKNDEAPNRIFYDLDEGKYQALPPVFAGEGAFSLGGQEVKDAGVDLYVEQLQGGWHRVAHIDMGFWRLNGWDVNASAVRELVQHGKPAGAEVNSSPGGVDWPGGVWAFRTAQGSIGVIQFLRRLYEHKESGLYGWQFRYKLLNQPATQPAKTGEADASPETDAAMLDELDRKIARGAQDKKWSRASRDSVEQLWHDFRQKWLSNEQSKMPMPTTYPVSGVLRYDDYVGAYSRNPTGGARKTILVEKTPAGRFLVKLEGHTIPAIAYEGGLLFTTGDVVYSQAHQIGNESQATLEFFLLCRIDGEYYLTGREKNLTGAMRLESDSAPSPSSPATAQPSAATQPARGGNSLQGQQSSTVFPHIDDLGEWGPAGKMLQLRLRRPQAVFRDDTLRLVLDARYTDLTTPRYLSVPRSADQVEVDGAWFVYSMIDSSSGIDVRPGSDCTRVLRLTPSYWHQLKPGQELAAYPQPLTGKVMDLSPGKHTIRYRSVVGEAREALAVSNAVDIEILPASTSRPADEKGVSDHSPSIQPASQAAAGEGQTGELYEAVRASPERLQIMLLWPRPTPNRPNLILYSGDRNSSKTAIQAKLTREQARSLTELLARRGYFGRATILDRPVKHYELEPFNFSSDSVCLLRVSVETDTLHRPTWAMFEELGGVDRAREMLEAMQGVLDGKAGEAVAKALDQTTPATRPASTHSAGTEADSRPTTQPASAPWSAKEMVRVGGHVLLPDGKPAAGVPVQVLVRWYSDIERWQELYTEAKRTGGPLPLGGVIEGMGADLQAVSDQGGRYAGELAPPYPWAKAKELLVVARTNDNRHAAVKVLALSQSSVAVELTVEPTGAAEFAVADPEGRATTEAKPFADSRLWEMNLGSSWRVGFAPVLEPLGGGRYRAAGLVPGWQYEFKATADGYFCPAGLAVEAKAGQTIDAGTLKLAHKSDAAWGKAVENLELGLRFKSPKAAYLNGEPVELVLLARNVGKDVLRLSYPDPAVTAWPSCRNADGRVFTGEMNYSGPVKSDGVALRAGETVELGPILMMPGGEGHSHQATSKFIQLLPGEYRVWATYWFSDPKGRWTTGELDLTVGTPVTQPASTPSAAKEPPEELWEAMVGKPVTLEGYAVRGKRGTSLMLRDDAYPYELGIPPGSVGELRGGQLLPVRVAGTLQLRKHTFTQEEVDLAKGRKQAAGSDPQVGVVVRDFHIPDAAVTLLAPPVAMKAGRPVPDYFARKPSAPAPSTNSGPSPSTSSGPSTQPVALRIEYNAWLKEISLQDGKLNYRWAMVKAGMRPAKSDNAYDWHVFSRHLSAKEMQMFGDWIKAHDVFTLLAGLQTLVPEPQAAPSWLRVKQGDKSYEVNLAARVVPENLANAVAALETLCKQVRDQSATAPATEPATQPATHPADTTAEARKLYEAVRAEPERLQVSLAWVPDVRPGSARGSEPERSSLQLHAGRRWESPAIKVKLTSEQAKRVADALAGAGYFGRVTVTVSDRGIMPLEPMPAKPPGYLLFVSLESDKAYQPKLSMFEDLGGDARAREILQALAEALTDKPKAAVEKVLAEIPQPTTATAP